MEKNIKKLNNNYNEEVERQLKVIAEVGKEPITISNLRNKLKWQKQDFLIRKTNGEDWWEAEFKDSYDRLVEKLNPNWQNNMKIFTAFWELNFHGKVRIGELFQKLEEWGYAKYPETEAVECRVICKKPYTDIYLIPHISIDGYMNIERKFVISEEVAKKLKEYFQQQNKNNKLF